jgi:hypothetical protein
MTLRTALSRLHKVDTSACRRDCQAIQLISHDVLTLQACACHAGVDGRPTLLTMQLLK